MQQSDSQRSLAEAKALRERIAERGTATPWYAPLYGLCVGGIVASGVIMPDSGGAALFVASLMALVILYQKWQRVTGLTVNGYRAGRTRWVAIAMVALLLLILAGGLWLRHEAGFTWAPLLAWAAAAIVAGFGSAAWDRAWRRDMEADA